MKYLLILCVLYSNFIYAINLGAENNEYLLFQEGKSKYIHDIGFDSNTTHETVLANYYYYYKSNNAKIGVFDIGFYFDHEEIKNTVRKGTSFQDSHGTFVASIVNGQAGNSKWFRGIVDPQYTYGLNIFEKGNTIPTITSYIQSLCPFFDVFSMSFELSDKSFHRKLDLYDEVEHINLLQKWRRIFNLPECKNTMFVLAGGNNQQDAVSSNGGVHYIRNISTGGLSYSPLNNVIVVGSHHNGQINNNYGESIDIYAPDNFYGPSKVVNGVSEYYTGPQSGSSISAPQVTATIGLLLKVLPRDPVKIKSYLLDKANLDTINSIQNKSFNTVSRPKLHAYKIIEKLDQDMNGYI